MYSIDITLREFISEIPSCLKEDSLETILAAAQSGKSEIIAIVNDQQLPLGIIDCQSLLGLLTQYYQERVVTSSTYKPDSDREIHCLPVRELQHLIKPATILQSLTTIRELLPYFPDDSLTNDKTKTYLIVNSQGQLLGSLDTGKLLQYLLFNSQTKSPTPLSIDRHLVNFLEAIALPIKLQAANGKVVYQNHSWRRLVEKNFIKSNPIPQWWLEQQENRASLSLEVSQSIAYNHCLKASPTLTSPPDKSQLTHHGNYLSDLFSPQSDRLNRDSILETFGSIKSNDWDYMQIPINLGDQKRNFAKTDSLSAYQLIVAVPSSKTAFDPEDCQDAELIELNRLKDELLANISHELKSPLTGIVGLSSLLKEQKLGSLNQRQLRYAELIYRSGRQLINLVSELLELTSLTTGKLKLNLEPIELKSFCQEAYQQVIAKLTKNTAVNSNLSFVEHNFQLNIEPGAEIAIADKLRLRQILSHLLTNSIKYSPPQRMVGINISSHSNWLMITVSDNGVGIPEVKQRSLLHPWDNEIRANFVDDLPSRSNLENCSYPQKSGMGLSFIIAQKLAIAHGGDISFISKVDSGSEFTLILPNLSERNENFLALNNTSSQRSNSLVLLVETNCERINRITSWVRELNYAPIVARTGTEALQKARCLQPSCILLNPTLPLLSGKDVLTLLKSDARTAHCLVSVMMTSHSTSETDLYQQADRLVSLPLTKMDLAAILPSQEMEYVEELSNLTPSETNNLSLNSRQILTILCLYPESEFIDSTKINSISNSNFNLKDWAERDWINDRSDRYNYRIIEADGLEQADMLASIWHLDTIVLDGSGLKEPLTYLRSLHKCGTLAALPLVTLDSATTEAANKIEGLAIYPCLIPAKSRNTVDLMQVIQIAAGINNH